MTQLEMTAPERDAHPAHKVIEDALTSAYGPRMDEHKLLNSMAWALAGRILLMLERAGYQITRKDAP